MEIPEASQAHVPQSSHTTWKHSTASSDTVRSELIKTLRAKQGFDKHALSDKSGDLNLERDEDSETRYLSLFLNAARHFIASTSSKTISSYVDTVTSEPLYSQLFGPSQASDEDKRADAENQLFSVLGTWFGLSPLFSKGAGKMKLRPILLVPDRWSKKAKERDLNITIETLLESCVFLPKSSDQRDLELPENIGNADEVLDLVESTKIKGHLLNAFTLNDYAHIEIRWVNNISRHMILSNRTGREELEVFEFPQITRIKHPLAHTHEFSMYKSEVWKSYCLLFPINNPVQHSGIFNRLGLRSRFCWCKSCKIRRGFERHNDNCEYATAVLFEALRLNWDSWNTNSFPILWHRILKLRDHQANARPATVRALWKDRRHPVQFYGTLFAAIVIPFSLITIALASASLVFAINGPRNSPTSTPTHTPTHT